jgi:tetratricopeptide (TPR) repeat protein
MHTFQERVFFGCYAFDAYLVKFIAPFKLSALYPYPALTGQPLPVLYYLSPLPIAAIAFAVFKSLKSSRAFVFGILFFVFSVIFLLQIFGAGQGFMADRYTKIPYVGLAFLSAWYLWRLASRKPEMKSFIYVCTAAFLVIFMVLTFQRNRIWKNGETLWTDVIEKYPFKDQRPYACRGLYYKTAGVMDKAVADFTTELMIDPHDADILQYRGNIYFGRGRDDSAYSDYIRAIKITQTNALAFANLGAIYIRRNQYDSAMINLSKALHMDSSLFTSYANRAVLYGALGKPDESILDFKRYLRSRPDDEKVMFSIGIAYQNKGEFEESITWFTKAIAKKPDFANYYWLRSQSFRNLGNKHKALQDALKAKELGLSVPSDYIRSLN